MMQSLQFRSVQEAQKIVGHLSKVTKLPCYTYNLPAAECITGQKLACVEGTTCHGCYALRGWYAVKTKGSYRRLEAIRGPHWTQAMIFLIKHFRQAYFRWHDSGDLQGVWHLDKICQVAAATPETMHWLPTREYEMVEKYQKLYQIPFPKNLIIRLSAHKINSPGPTRLAKALGVLTSTVYEKGFTCPATSKESPLGSGRGKYFGKKWKGHCGSCRKCWNPKIFNISYHLHLSKRGRPRLG